MHLGVLLLFVTLVNGFVPIKTITQALFNKMNIVSKDFSFYPKIVNGSITEQQKYDLQWVAINKDNTIIKNKLYRTIIKGKEYLYWKKSNGFYYAITNKLPIDDKFGPPQIDNIQAFDIANKNGWVYINTYGYKDKDEDIIRDFHIEEDIDNGLDTMRFFEIDSLLSADVLIASIVDISHFTLHYLFGNIYKEKYHYQEVVHDVGSFHTQMRRTYQCDKTTLSSQLVNINNVTIQNDLYLPYTASTKIIMGDTFVTLTCSCLPIKKNKTKIFMKVCHNTRGKIQSDFLDKLLRLMTVLLDTWSMAHTKNPHLWNTLCSKYK